MLASHHFHSFLIYLGSLAFHLCFSSFVVSFIVVLTFSHLHD